MTPICASGCVALRLNGADPVTCGVTRTFSPRFSLGVEVYHHTRDTREGADFTGLILGALYKLSDHWSVIGAGGPGVQNARRKG